jgi:hypothetical protein
VNFKREGELCGKAIPDFDAQMNYTQASYIAGRKQSIDLHLALFPRARLH